MEFLRNVPIGQYVSGRSGWLRKIDPRLKFAWVLMFLISPVLAGPLWRVSLVIALLGITFFGSLPLRILRRPLLYLIILSACFGILAIFLPTNELPSQLSLRSPDEIPELITSGSSWELLRINPINIGRLSLGPLIIDRRSAELAIKTSTLIFTVVHSVNLMLASTSPEDLMWTLRWYISPFALLGLPVDRMSFQLLLALRFIPLLQEEFQNLVRAVLNRSINFRDLGFKKSISLFLTIGERLLANILLRAEQGADALLIRNGGFFVKPQLFKPKGLFSFRTFRLNSACILILILFILLRRQYGVF